MIDNITYHKMKSEDKIQQEIWMYLHNEYEVQGKGVVFAVPNQNQWKLTNIGVRAGVSDLIFCTSKQTYFLEVKTDTGKQSAKQVDFQRKIEALGYKYHVVRSVEDVKDLQL